MIQIRRAYEPASSEDGVRTLVDRLWPRSVPKVALGLEAWQKDASKSNDLRKRFPITLRSGTSSAGSTSPNLSNPRPPGGPILEAARKGTVTLVYAAHDSEHNNAVALKRFLDERLK
jgi:uncharacterized protein YeaO (DUF488 family)